MDSTLPDALGVIAFSASLAIALLAMPPIAPAIGLMSWGAMTVFFVLITWVLPRLVELIKPPASFDVLLGSEQGRSPSETALTVAKKGPDLARSPAGSEAVVPTVSDKSVKGTTASIH